MMKSWLQLGVVFVKYVLGPILATLIGLYVGAKGQDQSSRGYRVLAQNINEQVLVKLLELDGRLDKLEQQQHAPASAPAVIPVGGRVAHLSTKAPIVVAKSPVTKVTVAAKAPPIVKAPPVAKAPPAVKAAPKAIKKMPLIQVPADLSQVK